MDFERADIEATQLQCAACERAIAGFYYTAGEAVLCELCRGQVEMERSAESPAGRLGRAAALGLGAAILGTLLWGGVVWITGYEIGLIAIAVGFLVGTAVRRGAQGQGGRVYQVLAVFLTYLSIVSTYVPYIVQGFEEMGEESAAPAEPGAIERLAASERGLDPAFDAQAGTGTELDASDDTVGLVEGEDFTAMEGVIGVIALLALAFAVPFLGGFDNIIGILIIGFALYEAWRLNQPSRVPIAGPFEVGAGASP